MNRDEYERLKEAEKAHLQKVRSLKEQLRRAQRTRNVAEALRKLDTADLGDEFDRALRAVEEQNLTAEARFELAMDALDAAERREQQRRELEQFEDEQRRASAADLVSRLKTEMEQEEGAPERHSSQATHGASTMADANPRSRDAPPQQDDQRQAKTIGRRQPRSD